MQHREQRTYAQADGRTAALADAWAEGWKAHHEAGPAAVNPYDGTSPADQQAATGSPPRAASPAPPRPRRGAP